MPAKVDFFPHKLPIKKDTSLKIFFPDLIGGRTKHRLKKKVALVRKRDFSIFLLFFF
jgi:hypothetical protein